jgi:hypothetical protein
MEITKEDFEAYVEVQKSGVTNMFAVNLVCQLSGLTKEKVLDIMENYGKYEDMYHLGQG